MARYGKTINDCSIQAGFLVPSFQLTKLLVEQFGFSQSYTTLIAAGILGRRINEIGAATDGIFEDGDDGWLPSSVIWKPYSIEYIQNHWLWYCMSYDSVKRLLRKMSSSDVLLRKSVSELGLEQRYPRLDKRTLCMCPNVPALNHASEGIALDASQLKKEQWLLHLRSIVPHFQI